MMLNVLKVFGLSSFAFFLGILITPVLTHYLYKHKAWKKTARTKAISGEESVVFNNLHKEKEVGTPRMGGIIVWASTSIVALLFFFLYKLWPAYITQKINFLSRSQTWLPLFTLVSASVIGLVDDLLQVGGKGGYIAGGLSLRKRILLVAALGGMGAWWFYCKLGISEISVPFFGSVDLGFLFIPFFIIVMLAVFSGGVIDGLDGLSGGVFASIFSAYAGVAFFQDQIDLAAFCAVIAGSILAFLWFNIPPARFYMTETGILGLTTSLTVVDSSADNRFPFGRRGVFGNRAASFEKISQTEAVPRGADTPPLRSQRLARA
jgi:phospho-N-acetylmuramoyl-pentapeptide-transferase